MKAAIAETAYAYGEIVEKPFPFRTRLSGTSQIQITISAQLAGFKGAPLTPMKTLWGWKATGDLIANTTNAGNSGGYSPLSVQLVNNIPTY